MKICNKCKRRKALSDFQRDKQKKDGYRPTCKECQQKVANQPDYSKDKECPGCKQTKAPQNFRRSRSRSDGLQIYCKECQSARALLSQYNISIETYNLLRALQLGKCAICNQIPTNTALSVDHDHTTKRVRGLLCNRCNMGLGYFQDSQHLLGRAIKYLEIPK
jgi:hypothetical protein